MSDDFMNAYREEYIAKRRAVETERLLSEYRQELAALTETEFWQHLQITRTQLSKDQWSEAHEKFLAGKKN